MRKCKDWLLSYLEYTKNQESPEIFHLWSGISVLAAALNRKCWVDRGYFWTYPNHYIVLVSASALCKKSTAADIATVHMYNSVFEHTPAVSKKITLQKLMVNLDKTCKAFGVSSCFLYNSELSVLVGRAGHSELMDFLTDVYGCPNSWVNETKGKGVDRLDNVFLNFLGCTTPEDLASMPSSMIGGGFSGRTIFVYSDTPRPPVHNPKLLFSENIVEQRADLVHDLQQISGISGPFELTQDADAIYKEIYDKNYYNRDTDFRMHPYQGRKGEHLIKLSMVIAASNRDGNTITSKDIQIANSLLENIEGKMVSTFAHVSYSGTSVSKHSERFLELLRKNKGQIDHSVALKKLYHYVNRDELKQIVETLQDGGLIEVIAGKKKIYKLKKEK